MVSSGVPLFSVFFEALRKFGLKGPWTGEASEARGIGGVAKIIGVVEVPVGVGQVPGVVALTVVAEDVPFLLPVNLLRALKASPDLGENRLHLRAIDCVMNVLPSGHPTVSVLDFGSGWFLPEICRGHVPESAFRSSPKQVQFSTGPCDHVRSSSTQARLATVAGGSDSDVRGLQAGRDSARPQRALLDKLWCVLQWAHYQSVTSQWLQLPTPEPSRSATSTTASSSSSGGGDGQGPGVPQLPGHQEAKLDASCERGSRGGGQQVWASQGRAGC